MEWHLLIKCLLPLNGFCFLLRSKTQSLFVMHHIYSMKYRGPFICTVVGLLFTINVFAQSTKINNDPDAAFKQAKDYYQQQYYSLAFNLFKDIFYHPAKGNFPTTIQSEVKYYYIVCGLRLNDSAAATLAVDYINLENNIPKIQSLSFFLGEYYFRRKNLTDALVYYNKSSIDNLSNDDVADLKFHKGYILFTKQQFAEAKPLLDAVRQLKNNSNYYDANYYYGFIVFSQKQYSEALNAFTIVENYPVYNNIVPFYIAEIYYFIGEKDKALTYAETKIKQGNQYYDLQLKQLVGHLWFDKKEYLNALPYLKEYAAKTDKIRREDLYELSYCYYAAGNWQESITGFKQLGGKEDSLAQNSMYLLADAYLKINDKPSARNAFQFCAANNSNSVQKEVSAFNYAKLSYELGFTDIALKALQNFIANYPTSINLLEAKELTISVLANTSNYKDALSLFESLNVKTEIAKQIYPRILYGRAVEMINDQQLENADVLLTKLIAAPYNEKQIQLAYFWKGEIAYRNNNLQEAINYFVNYLKNPQTNGEVNATNAKYNLAYCLLKKEQFTNALTYFQQVSSSVSTAATALEQDAYVRAADCYFMNKNYKEAVLMYNNIIALNTKGSDYALFQKAIIAGAYNKTTDKITLLQSLIKNFPNSTLIADANMELANTYLANENFANAIAPLQQILNDKAATAFFPRAYLKLGVAYFNLNKNDDALQNFTQLVSKFPNSTESDEAIEYIRNIFIEQEKPGEFITFMKQNGKPVNYSEQDSLTYRSAMLRYEAKDFAAAQIGFTSYLKSFADGKYAIEANYFMAEIFITKKDYNNALPYYNTVAAKAPNKYAERSSLQSARIYYFNLKDYNNAAKYFGQLKSIASLQENKLEAMRGLLRCQYKLQQWKEAMDNAQDLLKEKAIATDDKMMANLILGKSYQLDSLLDNAILSYKQVTLLGKSEFSAEAQYHIAEILLQQNKLPEAEKAGFETIKKYGSYDYWVTKSYILLGDVYAKEKDWFNAEATYKSVAENATDASLKKEASDKLAIATAEKAKTEKVEQN